MDDLNQNELNLITAYISGDAENLEQQDLSENHYVKAFSKFKEDKIINWNWYSAFFGGLHLLYRKNYLSGFIFFFLTMILSSLFYGIPYLFSFVLGGLFCDYLQYLRFKKLSEKIEKEFPAQNETQSSYLAREGGVNTVVVIVLSVLTVGLAAFLLYLGFNLGVGIFYLYAFSAESL